MDTILQLVTLMIIYGAMMFIWTFAYLNRSRDRINQAFLLFLSNILVWMLLNNICEYSGGTTFGLILKTVYWLSMMYLSVTFLFFIYRLLARRLDRPFFVLLGVNTFTVAARYCFPIDYSDPTFWRMSDPVVAPLMSFAFSLPALYALWLVLRQRAVTKDRRQRAQLSYILYGIGLALAVSVLSEYVLPAVLHVTEKRYLMYYAIAIFVAAVFISIMRYRLLSLRSDYLYRQLFLNASDGVLIVNKNGRIASANRIAREILGDDRLDAGDRVTDYIPEYRFDEDYRRFEVEPVLGGRKRYLSMTQHGIDESGMGSTKLLQLTDQTQARLTLEREKEQLLEKTNFDQLTGLFNKRYLQEKYGAQDDPGRKALLFLDVDDFKAINDRHGHLVGDDVLRAIAECMKDTVRSANQIVRFGGDEFLVVLDDTGEEDAFTVAERVRACVSALEFSGARGETFRVTLSIGLMEGACPMNELIEKADRAMYDSKNGGKNRTSLYRGNDPANEDAFHMRLF